MPCRSCGVHHDDPGANLAKRQRVCQDCYREEMAALRRARADQVDKEHWAMLGREAPVHQPPKRRPKPLPLIEAMTRR